MKKLTGYENAQVYKEFAVLPKGAYLLKILNAEEVTFKSGATALKISFDIADGDYEGFYKDQYKNQTREDKIWQGTYNLMLPKDDGTERDGWTYNAFKTAMTNIEESNKGFHWDWDEKKLKDKLIAGLFRIEEYEKNNGDVGQAVKCNKLISVEAYKSGKYKLPEDKLLKGNNKSTSKPLDDSDLPFNF